MTDAIEAETHPMRAVILVAYVHAEVGNEKITDLRDSFINVIDETEWCEGGLQMAAAHIVPLDSDEAIEWYVDDLDDLDSEDMEDMDDLREVHKHGSTPR